jgi:competence protein ComEC
MTGCLSLALGSSFTVCAEIFNHANRVFISLLLQAIDAMSAVPYGHSFVVSPPWYGVVLWYVLLACVLVMRLSWRRVAAVASMAVLGVAVWCGSGARAAQIDVLDVGHGSAAFVNMPGQSDVLVDTGPRFYAWRVIRHLRRCGVDRLKAIVLTHPDADHVGAATRIMATVPTEELWCSPYKGRSRVYAGVLETARSLGVHVRRMERGACGTWSGGVAWEVLHPDGCETYERAADASLVVRVARDAASVLFMGGAGEAVESKILAQAVEPAASVLVVGDHGAAGTCCHDWLEAVVPEVASISVGAHNRDGAPDADVLGRLVDRGVGLWRTDRQGSHRISFLGRAAARRAGTAVAITPL